MWSSLTYKKLATRRSFMVVVLLSVSLMLLMPTWSYPVSNQISWLQEHTDSDSVIMAMAMATDKHSNVLVGGWGETGTFLSKYNADGTLLWKRNEGYRIWGMEGIAVDKNDYIYIVGTMDSPSGGLSVFVRKYGPNGGRIWTRHFGSHKDIYAGGIAIYKNHIYVVGSTRGALPKKTSNGRFDAFIRKYDTDARLHWTRQFGTARDEGAEGVAVDARGYIYVVGGPMGDRGKKSFIRKYSPKGRVRWTKGLNNTAIDGFPVSVSVDSKRNVYIVGFNLMGTKGFAQKYSPGGKRRWRRMWSTFWTSAAAIDNRDNLYVFFDSFDWANTRSVAHIRKYSRSGKRRWTKKITAGAVKDVAVSVDNSLYAFGEMDAGWFLAKY